MKIIGWITLVSLCLSCISAPLLAQPASTPEEARSVEIAAAEQQKKDAQIAFDAMVAAITVNDMAAFVAQADDGFKAALTREMFGSVVTQLAPHLKNGYEATFVAQLKKKGYSVYLWKISLLDGGDDVLATLSLANGKVGGFFVS